MKAQSWAAAFWVSLSAVGFTAADVQEESQIVFTGPEGMVIHWDLTEPDKFDYEERKATKNNSHAARGRVPGRDGGGRGSV